MAAGYWGDTIQEFRPGDAFDNYYGTPASTINSRIATFYSSSNLSFWLKAGTFGNVKVTLHWDDFYNTSSVPASSPTDPNDSAYDWSLMDAYNSMANLSLLGGNPLIVSIGMTGTGKLPQWFISAGYSDTDQFGNVRPNFALAAARTAIKNFWTALAARYSSNRKFWTVGFSEELSPTNTTRQLGYAECVNALHDAFSGAITARIGGNSISFATLINACYATTGFEYPDPKMFTSGCTPTCTTGTARWRFQQEFENRPLLFATENNGLGNVTWPNGVSNPSGYNSSTPAHPPTAEELSWYFSSLGGTYPGVIPVHVLIWRPTEWAYSIPSLTLASILAANDKYRAGGTTSVGDSCPALPANYITTAPGSGEPDLPTVETFDTGTKSQGTNGASNTSPIPSGLSSDDLWIELLTTAGSLTTGVSNFSNVKDDLGNSFSLAARSQAIDATARPECAVYYKISDGTEASCKFDVATSQVWLCSGHRVSGAKTTSPIGQISSIDSGGTAVSTVTIPGITTTDDNSIVFIGAAFRSATPSSITLTSPSGTKIFEHDPSATDRDAAAFYVEVASQGATGDFVLSWTNATRVSAVAVEILGAPTATVDTTAPTLHASSAVTLYDATQTSQDILFNDATDDTAVIDYVIEQSLDGSTNWQVITTLTQSQKTTNEGSGYSYRVTGLTANTDYYYRYRARDAVPNVSSYSTVSAALSTDTPSDTSAPTGCAITGATYDSSTGDVTITASAGTDDVTAQGLLKYYIFGALSPDSIDYNSVLAGPFIGQTTYILQDLEVGDWTFGVRCEDSSSNRDTNTTTETVTVGVNLVSGTIEPVGNGAGSHASGDAYLYLAPQGTDQSINISDPSASASPITFNADGSVDVLTAGEAGTYDFFIVNSDGTLRASGWVDLA